MTVTPAMLAISKSIHHPRWWMLVDYNLLPSFSASYFSTSVAEITDLLYAFQIIRLSERPVIADLSTFSGYVTKASEVLILMCFVAPDLQVSHVLLLYPNSLHKGFNPLYQTGEDFRQHPYVFCQNAQNSFKVFKRSADA